MCLFPIPSSPTPNALKQTLFFLDIGIASRELFFPSQFFLLVLLPFHKTPLPTHPHTQLHSTSQCQVHVPNSSDQVLLSPRNSSLPASTGSNPVSPVGHPDPSKWAHLSSKSCISTVPSLSVSQPTEWPMPPATMPVCFWPPFSFWVLSSLTSTLSLGTL